MSDGGLANRNARVMLILVLVIGGTGVLFTLSDSSPSARWYSTTMNLDAQSGVDVPFFVQVDHTTSQTFLSPNGAIVRAISNPSPTPWLRFTDYASFTVSVSFAAQGTKVKLWFSDPHGNPAPNEAACPGIKLFCDNLSPSIVSLGSGNFGGDYYTEASTIGPYTFHLLNLGIEPVRGNVTLGVSTVVNSKPGFFIGLAVLAIAALYIVPEIQRYTRPLLRQIIPGKRSPQNWYTATDLLVIAR